MGVCGRDSGRWCTGSATQVPVEPVTAVPRRPAGETGVVGAFQVHLQPAKRCNRQSRPLPSTGGGPMQCLLQSARAPPSPFRVCQVPLLTGWSSRRCSARPVPIQSLTLISSTALIPPSPLPSSHLSARSTLTTPSRRVVVARLSLEQERSLPAIPSRDSLSAQSDNSRSPPARRVCLWPFPCRSERVQCNEQQNPLVPENDRLALPTPENRAPPRFFVCSGCSFLFSAQQQNQFRSLSFPLP